MKIAVLMLNTEQMNSNQYYNSQAEGKAKALAELGHEVIVYHLVPKLNETKIVKQLQGVQIEYIRTKHLGKHAIVPTGQLHKDTDLLITIPDNYLDFKRVYKWANRQGIFCLPYIGVLRSNNDNKYKKMIVDFFFDNTKHYLKIPVTVKTPYLKKVLEKKGAKDVTVIPPGLDESLLHTEYGKVDIASIRSKWGFDAKDKILLFIGRMTQEKQPILMLDIMEQIYKIDQGYKLFMIGTGVLLPEVKRQIVEKRLEQAVTLVEKIDNKDIWECYRMADWSINLNTHEIFGMAILEAMYYECPVAALHAQGPDSIIQDGKTGRLCNTPEEIVEVVMKEQSQNMGAKAHESIEKEFVWKELAGRFVEVYEKEGVRKCK